MREDSLYSLQRVWTPESRELLRRSSSRRATIDQHSARSVKKYWEESKVEILDSARSGSARKSRRGQRPGTGDGGGSGSPISMAAHRRSPLAMNDPGTQEDSESRCVRDSPARLSHGDLTPCLTCGMRAMAQ